MLKIAAYILYQFETFKFYSVALEEQGSVYQNK